MGGCECTPEHLLHPAKPRFIKQFSIYLNQFHRLHRNVNISISKCWSESRSSDAMHLKKVYADVFSYRSESIYDKFCAGSSVESQFFDWHIETTAELFVVTHVSCPFHRFTEHIQSSVYHFSMLLVFQTSLFSAWARRMFCACCTLFRHPFFIQTLPSANRKRIDSESISISLLGNWFVKYINNTNKLPTMRKQQQQQQQQHFTSKSKLIRKSFDRFTNIFRWNGMNATETKTPTNIYTFISIPFKTFNSEFPRYFVGVVVVSERFMHYFETNELLIRLLSLVFIFIVVAFCFPIPENWNW